MKPIHVAIRQAAAIMRKWPAWKIKCFHPKQQQQKEQHPCPTK